MYRCRMKIAVFSKDTMLYELVRSLEPLEHFTHEITVAPEANQEIMRESRLIIWNLDDPVPPSVLRSRCAGDALLIFCGSRQRLGALDPEEFEAAEEFWETPLVWDYIKVRLKRMMEQIKLGYDYYITQTYLDTAIDSIPDMLWFKTLDGIHVKVNKAFCSVVGKTREDVTDSLTVHSLAIKRAARLNMFREEYGGLKIQNTPEMIELSAACARQMGMEPYYLYRQKNMAGNFENVGYSLPGKACIYNILIMEEMQTIAACGAGTTTKVVFPSENRRERCENVKEVEQYISRIDEMIQRKERIL